MHKRLSRAALHLIWYALVTSLILFGLFISLIWVTHNSLDQLTPKILSWVENRTGVPITVEEATIEWHGIFPELSLGHVQVLNPDTQSSMTEIRNARLRVDLPGSLKHWQVTLSQLTLDGVSLHLEHAGAGKFVLKDWPASKQSEGSALDWLMRQQTLSLRHARVSIEDNTSLPSVLILDDLSADWSRPAMGLEALATRRDTQRLITAKAGIQNTQAAIELAAKLNGDPREPNWELEVLTATDALPLNMLFQADQLSDAREQLAHLDFQFPHPLLAGSLNLRLEAKEDQLSLQTADGKFSLSDQESLDRIASPFRLRHDEQSWQVVLSRLQIEQDHVQLLLDGIDLTLPKVQEKNPTLHLAIDSLDLPSTSRFLSQIDDIRVHLPEVLQTSQLLGSLNHFKLVWNQTTNSVKFDTEFVDLGLSATKTTPGLQGLSGTLRGDQDNWQLSLNSQHVRINPLQLDGPSSGPITTPLSLAHVHGHIDLVQQANSRELIFRQLQLDDPRLQLQINGSLHQQADDVLEAQINGTVFGGDVGQFASLFPSGLLPKKTEQWLNNALQGGQITGGTVQLQGDLAAFPFDDNNGVFDIRLNVEDGILKFDPEWPQIDHIFADVRFVGRQMIITSPDAAIYDTALSDVEVRIPDIMNRGRHIMIDGRADGTLKDTVAFLGNTPLDDPVGQRLRSLELTGVMGLDLKLDIPLHSEAVTQVDGIVHLNDASLKTPSPPVSLSRLSGTLRFDRDNWYSKSLQARLYGSPVKLHLENRSENANQTIVTLQGVADRNYLTARLTDLGLKSSELVVLDHLSGSTNWQATMQLNEGKNTSQKLIIESDLVGMGIDLPAPLGKRAQVKRPLKIQTTLDKPDPAGSAFEYGEIVAGRWLAGAASATPELQHLTLKFGPPSEMNSLPELERSVSIAASGQILELDLDEWQAFLAGNPILSVSDQRQSSLTLATDLAIGIVNAGGYRFKNNQINLKKRANDWEINLQNHAMDGTIHKEFNGAITAAFDRLHLTGKTQSTGSKQWDLSQVPPLDIQAADFSINALQLGALRLISRPKANGLNVEKLTLASPTLSVSASGDWHYVNTQQQSRFLIEAKSETLEGLLSTFGYNVDGIHAEGAEISSQASWSGTPADFSLDRVQGNLRLDIGKGRLTEVDNRVGKVFGLLSIQTLGRRLSLDFNDLFQKGFTFDSISGNFEVTRGDAFTNNLSVTGPSADIFTTGRVGLEKQDYDQTVTVIPSVSDSLPMAGALFGPVGAGVGAAIFLAEKIVPGLPGTIDNVLKRQYSVQGSWENPTVSPITPLPSNSTSDAANDAAILSEKKL